MSGTSLPVRIALATGPVLFAALFLFRSVRPTLDPTLVSIGVVLGVVTAGLVAGRRWAAIAYPVFPVALFVSPAARDLSFDLTAVDSTGWRWFALVSLLSLGTAIAAVVLVLVDRRTTAPVGVGALVGGLAVGGLMIVGIQAIEPQPAFGADLSDEEIAALPVIELVNYGYLADGPVTVPADGTFRARLENPSDLPHTFTVESADVDVYVPSERWAIVELDGAELTGDEVVVICTIGDHLEQGMQIRAVVS